MNGGRRSMETKITIDRNYYTESKITTDNNIMGFKRFFIGESYEGRGVYLGIKEGQHYFLRASHPQYKEILSN